MIAELLFLLGIEYQEGDSRLQCGIVAGLLHYTFLGEILKTRSTQIPENICGILVFISKFDSFKFSISTL